MLGVDSVCNNQKGMQFPSKDETQLNSASEKLTISYRKKGKVCHRTGHEGPRREWKYTSNLSLTTALDGMGGKCHAPTILLLGMTQCPL
jgi:hypothetical protein